MTNPDKSRFVEAFARLCATFRVEPTEVLLDAYWSALSDLAIGAIAAAMVRALTYEERFPVPAVLRRLTGEKSPAEEAVEKWADVRRQISAVGYYGAPNMDTAMSRAVRALGGWQRLCSIESRDLDFIAKDFRDIYRVDAESARVKLLIEAMGERNTLSEPDNLLDKFTMTRLS